MADGHPLHLYLPQKRAASRGKPDFTGTYRYQHLGSELCMPASFNHTKITKILPERENKKMNWTDEEIEKRKIGGAAQLL